MKKILLPILLATFVFCGNAFSQSEEPGKIYVNDLVGLPSDPMVFGNIPWETLVYSNGGGGSTNQYYLWLGSGAHSVAFGKEITVEGKNGGSPEHAYSSVIGPQSESIGYGNTLIGHMTKADGDAATAIGRKASVESWYGGTAIGIGAKTKYGYAPIAIGNAAYAGGTDSTDGTSAPLAIGHNSKAVGSGAVAIGLFARAEANMAIQIGSGRNTVPRSARIGDAVFVDVAETARTFSSRIDSVSADPAALKTFIKSFLEALTVPYEIPETDPVDPDSFMDEDYRDMLAHSMFNEILERLEAQETVMAQSLEAKPVEEDDWKSTWHDFIQYVIMAVLALVAIIRRKKHKQDDKPEDDVKVESKSKRK